MANCIETVGCIPQNVPDVLNLYDVWFGSGMTIVMMALIIGIITMAIYLRTRSMSMLAILATYEVAVFGSILSSKYLASQYQLIPYIVGLSAATGLVMLFLRLVKE
jgi:hypothetical protein